MFLQNFFVFGLLISSAFKIAKTSTLTLYRESFSNHGETLELNVDNCTRSLPSEFLGKISCGNFTVTCARFYSTEECLGNSVELQKSQVSIQTWKLENIKSIGPCDTEVGTKCTVTKDPIPVVHLFEHADFQGRVVSVTLNHVTCFEIPTSLKRRISSIQMKADVCVQLHSNSNCSDEGISVRRNKQTAVNLAQWGFDDKTASISLCGLSCRRKLNTKISTITTGDKDPVPRCPYVTIFDEKNFTGNAKHLVFEDCINLEGDWEGTAASINMSRKECVILYNLFDCGSAKNPHNAAGYQKQILNHTFPGYDLHLYHLEGQVRSIGPCEGKKLSQPHIPILVLIALFITGIFVAWLVNMVVQKRDRKERQFRIYHDKPHE